MAAKKKPTAWQKSFSSGFKGTKTNKSTGISNTNTQDQSPAAKEKRRKARAKARSKA